MINTKDTQISSPRPTRVLFLAWGYSIHAERRIRCFAEDNSFEVCIVSTFGYTIPRAKIVNLRHVKTSKREKEQSFLKQTNYSWKDRIQGVLNWTFPYSTRFLSLISELLQAIRDIRAIQRTVFKFKPDVVFLQTLLYPCYLWLFLNSNIKSVITFWNGDVLWWAQYTGIEKLFKKQIVRHSIKRSTAITVNSASAREACIKYGAVPEKVHIIRYPGVDRNRFMPSSKEIARKHLRITADKVVLCPRGLGAYLNSDIIIEAASRVIKMYPETLFLFISGVGEEKELANHQKMTRELDIEKNFRWDGQVQWGEMPSYYAASDIMVSISSNDSLPNCMLESMACKIPVIMGDIPQIREWVADGTNGFLVQPRDPAALAEAISKVFQNKGRIIYSFVSLNLELISREADSNINIKRVKDLVRNVAGFSN